ncbi:MAG TPA: RNA-binding protein [Actinobacteria bacterium]|nr:RNA-binding protein [Actinomycetota bacterium]
MENTKLYVGNLNYSVDMAELKDLFAPYGEVKYVKVIEGKGFGFVDMANAADAVKARNELNGTDFKGRKLKIDEARPQQQGDRPPRPQRDYN